MQEKKQVVKLTHPKTKEIVFFRPGTKYSGGYSITVCKSSMSVLIMGEVPRSFGKQFYYECKKYEQSFMDCWAACSPDPVEETLEYMTNTDTMLKKECKEQQVYDGAENPKSQEEVIQDLERRVRKLIEENRKLIEELKILKAKN